MKILLNKRYWCYTDRITQVEKVEAEFKSQGLVISDTANKSIIINRKGQRILYDELKKRFKNVR